jgi:glycerophosphoryl diester phosphodiesterase
MTETVSGRLPLILAHRGAAMRFPENTISAFDAALDEGADGFECDVRVSADGVPLVIHDSRLRRLTGERGRLARLPYKHISSMRIKGREKIPTLETVLDRYTDRCLLLLEFKETAAVRSALEMIGDGSARMIQTCSFNPATVELSRRLRPDIPSFLITGSFDPNPLIRWRENFPRRTLLRTGATGLSCHFRMLSLRRALRAARERRPVYTWSFMFEERRGIRWHGAALPYAPAAIITARPGEMHRRVLEAMGTDRGNISIYPELALPDSCPLPA